MSILDNTSKRILVQSMRNVMENAVVDNAAYLSESQIIDAAEFVHENATYEQLLNVAFNPYKDTKYLPAHILEGAAAILHSACLTGRRVIGVNAITEGAIMLAEKTGCVITESMLDAAYNAAVKGDGLKVIGESFVLSEGKITDTAKKAWDSTKSGAKKAWDGTKSGAKKAWDGTKSGAKKTWGGTKKITGIDDIADYLKTKKDVKEREALKERFPTHWSVADIDELKKNGRKSLAKGAGKSAATLAALAAAGYGIKKIVDWRKKKKKDKKED